MALENCLRVTTVGTATPQCFSPFFPSSRDKLVFPTHRGFKKSLQNSTLSYPYLYSTGAAYRKSRFVCNAREAVNEAYSNPRDSPYLFTLILDVLTEQIQEIAPRCMLFADDIVLLGESREELNERLETWRRALETHGFRLSRSKSEYMECKFNKRRRVSNSEVKIGDHIIPQVTRFKYLGSVIQDDGEIEGDVNHRIQAGWMKWRKTSGVLCDAKVPIKLKGKFYRTAVRPAILYGTECWAVKSQHENKVGVAEMRMLRWMCGKTRQDKIRNEAIRERVGVAPIVEKMVENRLRWFGHVERRPVDSVVRRVDQMERRQTIRGRGRPKKTIREVIKKDLEINGLDRIKVVTDSSWNNLVIASETPVLVEFWAPWCGPCRMIAPAIDELAKEYAGKIACFKLNTDDSPNIATQYGIRSIPTVLFFKNGEKKESIIGAVPKSTLSATVEKYVDS
ncbi:Thioredoxin M-type, chloroplastic [Glycine soja]|uniref:Thioredoxin M-type, chloroplastic n=1 Tax=Glycine soja TaxID=3848 RepID=A0A445K8H7_GLYSO|nr:Thioredoxin M-type, chloroplastic [Glycine soja]